MGTFSRTLCQKINACSLENILFSLSKSDIINSTGELIIHPSDVVEIIINSKTMNKI